MILHYVLRGFDSEMEKISSESKKDKVYNFIKRNPYPSDDKMHRLADQNKTSHEAMEGAAYSLLSDFINHGEAKKFKGKYNSSQLKAGTKVEKEHTNNPRIARRIAKDHLAEFGDYYTRLKKMEDKAEEEK